MVIFLDVWVCRTLEVPQTKKRESISLNGQKNLCCSLTVCFYMKLLNKPLSSLLPVVRQLKSYLYESIGAHLVGLWDIFPKVAKNNDLHIQVPGQAVVGEMSGN